MTQLVRYEQARTALAAANGFDEVKDIRDQAEAMAAYARQAKDTELIQLATEIKVRAERKAGAMLFASAERGERATKDGNVNQHRVSNDSTPTLTDIGISRDDSSRWQKLAKMPEEHFEAAVATAKESVGQVTTAFLLREAKAPHVTNNSGENEWYTPPRYIDAARKAMGGIDTDPASNEFANKTVKAKRFFSIDDDGLQQKWAGRVWMNPPYAQPLIADFIEAAVTKYEAGEFDEACVLVNNATETQWFQRLLEKSCAVCFIKGRIKYHDSTGTPANTPLQGQAVVYLGTRPKSFALAFNSEGTVLFHG